MVALARKPAVSSEKLAGVSLAVRNIDHGFTLHGDYLPVLEDVSFQVEPGEFVALLGPSGCGKSTLLRLVAGLDRPRRGSLTVDDVEVTGPDPSRVVVFQDPTLYPWRTVWRNASLGLEKFAKAFPHQLSGGMAQRASLARALVNDPTLLILDEPLGKLDSLTRLAMQGELTRLWQRRGFTVLMVTHDVEEALLLSNRVIVFSDRPARLRADLAVDLPYPRHRDHPELLRLRREALGLLGLAGDW
jgi:NitT/TauT family transport system ATP-binding protein